MVTGISLLNLSVTIDIVVSENRRNQVAYTVGFHRQKNLYIKNVASTKQIVFHRRIQTSFTVIVKLFKKIKGTRELSFGLSEFSSTMKLHRLKLSVDI